MLFVRLLVPQPNVMHCNCFFFLNFFFVYVYKLFDACYSILIMLRKSFKSMCLDVDNRTVIGNITMVTKTVAFCVFFVHIYKWLYTKTKIVFFFVCVCFNFIEMDFSSILFGQSSFTVQHSIHSVFFRYNTYCILSFVRVLLSF